MHLVAEIERLPPFDDALEALARLADTTLSPFSHTAIPTC
jgi:hypothetical protein